MPICGRCAKCRGRALRERNKSVRGLAALCGVKEGNMESYAIHHSHGQTETGFDTYEDAIAAVKAVYSDVYIGHDGDISDGGERTLCWASEEDSHSDDGARACCSIWKRH